MLQMEEVDKCERKCAWIWTNQIVCSTSHFDLILGENGWHLNKATNANCCSKGGSVVIQGITHLNPIWICTHLNPIWICTQLQCPIVKMHLIITCHLTCRSFFHDCQLDNAGHRSKCDVVFLFGMSPLHLQTSKLFQLSVDCFMPSPCHCFHSFNGCNLSGTIVWHNMKLWSLMPSVTDDSLSNVQPTDKVLSWCLYVRPCTTWEWAIPPAHPSSLNAHSNLTSEFGVPMLWGMPFFVERHQLVHHEVSTIHSHFTDAAIVCHEAILQVHLPKREGESEGDGKGKPTPQLNDAVMLWRATYHRQQLDAAHHQPCLVSVSSFCCVKHCWHCGFCSAHFKKCKCPQQMAGQQITLQHVIFFWLMPQTCNKTRWLAKPTNKHPMHHVVSPCFHSSQVQDVGTGDHHCLCHKEGGLFCNRWHWQHMQTPKKWICARQTTTTINQFQYNGQHMTLVGEIYPCDQAILTIFEVRKAT